MIMIIQDRYTGAYSNAIWTAWDLLYPESLPAEIAGSDTVCSRWWGEYERDKDEYSILVGKGNTPQEALDALLILKEERTKIRIAESRKRY